MPVDDFYHGLRVFNGGVAEASGDIWRLEDEWDEEGLMPRQWIARGYMMRGAVTILSGSGAAGKSMLSIGYAIALAHGIEWGKFHPLAPCRVALYNVEDDDDEQKRRLSAALRQHDLAPRDIAGRVLRCGPTGVGTLLDFDGATGQISPTATWAAAEKMLDEFQPDVLFLDPLVELHTAGENDNTALRAIIAFFRGVAQARNIAIVIVHHARKGPQSPGDPDTLRGASAVVGAARVVLTCTVMSEEEAGTLNVPPDHRRSFFRVDGAKSNYAPLREAEWYERMEYDLANGDLVSAAVPWKAPTVALTTDLIETLLQGVEAGMGGTPWSPKLSSDERSIKTLFERHSIATPKDQKKALDALMERGCSVGEFTLAKNPHTRGLRTSMGQPEVKWKA